MLIFKKYSVEQQRPLCNRTLSPESSIAAPRRAVLHSAVSICKALTNARSACTLACDGQCHCLAR